MRCSLRLSSALSAERDGLAGLARGRTWKEGLSRPLKNRSCPSTWLRTGFETRLRRSSARTVFRVVVQRVSVHPEEAPEETRKRRHEGTVSKGAAPFSTGCWLGQGILVARNRTTPRPSNSTMMPISPNVPVAGAAAFGITWNSKLSMSAPAPSATVLK